MVVVVIQALIAIVGHGGNGDRQIINEGGVQLRGGDLHAVVAGADDAGDVVGGVASLNTGGVLAVQISPQAAGSNLSVVQGVIVEVAVLIQEVGVGAQAVPIVSGGGIDAVGDVIGVAHAVVEQAVLGKAVGIAPHQHTKRDLQALVGVDLIGGVPQIGLSIVGYIVSNAIVHDGLSESSAGGGQALTPEGGLSGLIPIGEVGVVLTGSQQQSVQGAHAVAVLIQAHDGGGVHGGGAVIGGIQEHIHGEDHVVDVGIGAVGELDVLPHDHGVGDGAVVVLGDGDVGGAIVGVVGAVVGTGLALDAIQNRLAHTVRAHQVQLGHIGDVHVVHVGGEERGELLLQAGDAGHQGVVPAGAGLLGGGVVGSLGVVSGLSVFGGIGVIGGGGVIGARRVSGVAAAAAGCHGQNHHQRQKQCKQFLDMFHFCFLLVNLQSPASWERPLLCTPPGR